MKGLWIQLGIVVVILAAGAVLFILPGKSQAPTIEKDPHADLIVINAPTIAPTGITATGKARGTWYFEASFPVQLLDASGQTLAQVPAQAQSDWMTAEFVPFSVTLTFAKQPAGSKGTLLFKKDNPSGDPSKDDSIEVPVLFN